MKIEIKPLKQLTELGCMSTCYAMVRNTLLGEKEFNLDEETKLFTEAFTFPTGVNEQSYLLKLAQAGCEIKILVETPYVVDLYKQFNKKYNLALDIEYTIIGVETYEKLLSQGYLLITLSDLWEFTMICHFSHYVLVNGFDYHSLYVVDPKQGIEIQYPQDRFARMLHDIKTRMGYSPIIFAIKYKRAENLRKDDFKPAKDNNPKERWEQPYTAFWGN